MEIVGFGYMACVAILVEEFRVDDDALTTASTIALALAASGARNVELRARATAALELMASLREASATARANSAASRRASALRRKRWVRQRGAVTRPGRALSPDAVDSLHEQYAATRDPALRDVLLRVHAGLAHRIATRFQHRGELSDDVHQVALMSLVKALDGFDPARGLKFSTYATPTIVGELKRHFRDRTWTVRLPRRLHDRYLELQRARDDLAHELGRSPTPYELAERLGASVDDVLEAMEASHMRGLASLDATVGDDETDLGQRIGLLDERLAAVDLQLAVGSLLDHLTGYERDVVRLRFFSGLTQTEIAARLGTNQMHVSRALGRALGRLRALAASEG
jgi:RNA polymerase sigma-B factor